MTGALPSAATVVDLAAADAAAAAERAAGFADVVRADSRALLLALGGGPPTPLAEAAAQAESAAVALDRAAAALGDAAVALRSFAGQLT